MIDQPKGKDLLLRYKVITNQYNNEDVFLAKLTISNQAQFSLKKGWKIYFNFLRKIYSKIVSAPFIIDHINGDFYCLYPSPSFVGLEAGDTIDIEFTAKYWSIKNIEKPTGFFIVYQDDDGKYVLPQALTEPIVSPFVLDKQTHRTPSDKTTIPTAELRYETNRKLHLLPKDDICPILPEPKIFRKMDGLIIFSKKCKVNFNKMSVGQISFFQDIFSSYFDFHQDTQVHSHSVINMSIDQTLFHDIDHNTDAYSLRIDPDGITILAGSDQGLFYATQSLIMLLGTHHSDNRSTYQLPHCYLEDFPDLGYRGLHLDIARNFQKPETIKKIIRIMGVCKLNRLHLHLTDDEGWRLEIPGLQELTEIGSKRGFCEAESLCILPSYGSGFDYNDPDNPGNGFYSKETFIDILRYAAAHFVVVIPEIDLPGHARAAIKAMDSRYNKYMAQNLPDKAKEYLLSEKEDTSIYESVQMWKDNVVNPALTSTYCFIEKVVEEIKNMYVLAGLTLEYFHIGGDEVPLGTWEHSPACKQLSINADKHFRLFDYFLEKTHHILQEKGIKLCGWEETAIYHEGSENIIKSDWIKKGLMPFCWNTTWGDCGETLPYRLINAGFDTVLCNAPTLYFDAAYDKDPEEDGFYWAGFCEVVDTFRFLPYDYYRSASQTSMGDMISPLDRYINAPKIHKDNTNHLKGIQGQLWGETLISAARMEYMMLPRMLALSERAWNAQPLWSNQGNTTLDMIVFEKDWNIFCNKLGQHFLPFLDTFIHQISYRIPPPGIRIENGLLYANTAFPGFIIKYTIDGSMPDQNSPIYESPLDIHFDKINMCVCSPSGIKSRVSSWCTKN